MNLGLGQHVVPNIGHAVVYTCPGHELLGFYTHHGNLDRLDVTALNLFYVLKEMAGGSMVVTLILCMVIVLALEARSPTALESDR
jgi:hypothetical protein